MYSEKVSEVLANPIWFLATAGEEPNVVPMGMKAVLPDGTLAIANNFMNTTLANILANGKAAVCAINMANPLECYEVKGTATYVTEGPVVEQFKAAALEMFKTDMCKGAVLIKPEKVINMAPGPQNNEEEQF